MINPLRLILTWFGLAALVQVLSRTIRLTVTPADWLMGFTSASSSQRFCPRRTRRRPENAIARRLIWDCLLRGVAVRDLASYHYFVRAAADCGRDQCVFGAIEMVSGYSLIRGRSPCCFTCRMFT